MKYLITILSFFTLSFAEAEASVRVFTNEQIDSWRSNLSHENLVKSFNNDELSRFPLDRIKPIYEKNVLQVKTILDSIENNENGYKLNAQEDKELLVFIVEMTRKYSQNFDPGNGHYRVFSKLYRSAPKDLNLAIESSKLSAYDKKIVRANIR